MLRIRRQDMRLIGRAFNGTGGGACYFFGFNSSAGRSASAALNRPKVWLT